MPPPLIHLRIFFTVSLCLCALIAPAQKSSDHEILSTAHGLSQGMIFDMLQDNEGFIWIATKEGLNRYDGYGFKVFTNNPSDSNSLSSNFVRSLFEDSKGRIWAGTLDAGISIYSKVTGRFKRIIHQPGKKSGLSGNRIMSSMVELPDGRVVASAQDHGLDIISLPDNYFDKDVKPTITHLDLPGKTAVHGIGKDDKGNIWIGGVDAKIYLYDAATGEFGQLSDGKTITSLISKAGKSLWSNRDVFVIDRTSVFRVFDTLAQIVPGTVSLDHMGKIFIDSLGTPPPGKGALFYYDLGKWKMSMPIHAADFVTFKSSLIHTQLFMVDRSGLLWSGTSGFGVNKYNLRSASFHHLASGFSSRNIRHIGNDILFLTGWTSRGRWITTTGQALKNPFGKYNGDDYFNFIATRAGEYWMWNYKHQELLQLDAKSQKKNAFKVRVKADDQLQPMAEDSRGNIWLCGLNGELTRINPATGVMSDFSIHDNRSRLMLTGAQTTSFYEDAAGTFWIGTEEGFARMSFQGDDKPAITWFHNQPAVANSLNYNYVSAFVDDPRDNKFLWISTKGGGLNRLEKSTGKISHITTKQGLPNDVVYGILTDSVGNIWGSTNKGIFCLLQGDAQGEKKWTIKTFSKTDGLQEDEFNTNGFLKLPDGRLVFAGVNGLNIFDPKEILAAGFMPNVFITDIQLGNLPVIPGDNTGILQQTIETTKAITLTHLQDVLTLEFSALDFTSPLQNKYRYQMVGVDNDWVESGRRRSATYMHLPPGTYNFKVQGSNSQGSWSDKIAALQVTVLPPWWRTWWAYIFYALVLGICVRAYFRFSVNRAKLRAQLNFEQLEAKRAKELDIVKTQLYTNITHEFRTPLTVILGMAHQLMNKPQEGSNNALQMIIRNGQSLLTLVNEMLDLSKLESGKMSLQLANGDIIVFLRYVVDSFHSLAESEQKRVHFLTDLDALHVAYDAEKIRQIAANLLSNALKFTPTDGNIYFNVSINVIPNDEPNITLIIKIKDTGIGIPEKELQHIFNRFYQLDNSHTRNAGGTGIGLALTKELVRLMEGEIMVKSPPAGADKGTEFTVLLPMITVPATGNTLPYLFNDTGQVIGPASPIHQDSFSGNHHPLKNAPEILLVEDNADVLAYTASCLSEYNLSVGKDGREGFEKAIDSVPDLIITDVMMPYIDGFELCRRLRANEHTSHIPIIMLTAKADIESKITGLEQGADVYLQKPFHKDELHVRVRKLLEQRRQLQQIYLKQAGLLKLPNPDVFAGAANGSEQSIITPAKNSQVPVNTAPVPPSFTRIEEAFLKKVKESIETHLSDPDFTVERLCKMIYMSHSQLHRKLDALTGCSPNRFIRMIRLNKAKILLADPDNSIGSIAIDCGYNDPGYFARVFKQEYGVTPHEWRTTQSVTEG